MLACLPTWPGPGKIPFMNRPFWRDWIAGMANICNIFPPPPPMPGPVSNAEIARLNEKALADDWNAVGGDMRKAMAALEEEKRKGTI